MDHQFLLWTLQACWEAVWVFAPVVALAAVAWRVAR
jgi:hypothetical protein